MKHVRLVLRMIVTGPNLERINKMPQNEDVNIGTRNRYSFCFVAILLLLVAIFATFMQKLCESNLAIARGNEVRMLMGTAKGWLYTSLLFAMMSILSWCLVVCYNKNKQNLTVTLIILWFFYIFLQFIIV